MKVTKRDLLGRKIVDVNFRRFATDRPKNPWTTAPILTLDNGRRLWFVVAETEVGEYGVEISISKRERKT